MSHERKDVRAKLDPDMHEQLCRAARAHNLDLGELVETVLVKWLTDRVHAYIQSQAEFEGSPVLGKIRAQSGKRH